MSHQPGMACRQDLSLIPWRVCYTEKDILFARMLAIISQPANPAHCPAFLRYLG